MFRDDDDNDFQPPTFREVATACGLIAVLTIVLVILSMACGCNREESRTVTATDDDKAKAVALVALLLDKPQPLPEPTPADKGICDNCRGTGVLGDGTIKRRCPVCGGDGRTDQELPSVLATLAVDRESFAAMKPARRWQAIVVSGPGCKACQAMKAECESVLGASGWSIDYVTADARDGEIVSDADLVFDERTYEYERYGIAHPKKRIITIPHMLVFGDGEIIDRFEGAISARILANRINEAVRHMAPRSMDYGAIPGGTIHAADEITAALDAANKFLGPNGSITIARPAGEVAVDKATVVFGGATTIRIVSTDGKITGTCVPPPRLSISGVPLIRPGLQGFVVSREAITLNLLRWPKVTINVKESR